MALRTTKLQWGAVTRLLHWTVALLVIGMIAAGLYAVSLDTSTPAGDQAFFAVIDLHKSFGLVVLMLMAVRVVWRLSEQALVWLPTTPLWEKVLAYSSQALIYIGLFVMPVSGFLWATAFGEPMRLFGFKLPGIIHLKGPAATLAKHVHVITAFVLIAIVSLHIAGALKNHFINRNDVLRNMLGLPLRHPAPVPAP